jgi:hypothetical protein
VIRGVAFSIAAELTNHMVTHFMDEAIQHIDSADRWIRHHSANILARGSSTTRHSDFIYILDQLDDGDDAIAGDALLFVVRALRIQIAASLERLRDNELCNTNTHVEMLSILLSERVSIEQVRGIIYRGGRLERAYGVAIGLRHLRKVADFHTILEDMPESYVRRQALWYLKSKSGRGQKPSAAVTNSKGAPGTHFYVSQDNQPRMASGSRQGDAAI